LLMAITAAAHEGGEHRRSDDNLNDALHGTP
jgi:hypothetical protein